jgi:hypothetical protein
MKTMNCLCCGREKILSEAIQEARDIRGNLQIDSKGYVA